MNYQDFTKIPAMPPPSQSIPFYQGFPMVPLYGYDHIENENQDTRYARYLCSNAVKRIQEEVDEECDKLEYNGSCMYHKYPDKVHLEMISSRIYERVKDLPIKPDSIEMTSLTNERCFGKHCPPPPPPRPPHPPYPPCRGRDCMPQRPIPDYDRDGKPNWLKNLIDVLLFNEMNHRRRRYRSRNPWF